MTIEKVDKTRTIKRKAKNLNIAPNYEELTDSNNKRKTTIIERIYSDKTIDEEPDPEPEPPKRVKRITPLVSQSDDEVEKERPPPVQKPIPQIVINDNNEELLDQLRQKIINLENKSNKLEAVNGIFLDTIRNKMIPNKPNEIVNQPVSNFSKSIDIPQQPYQPYIIVSPQVPQEVPQYIPVYPVIQPQPIVQPQLIKSQSLPDFSMDRYSNQYVQNVKDSLKALDRGLQGYFCKYYIVSFFSSKCI